MADLLHSDSMCITVTLVTAAGKRPSAYAVKMQRPEVGWLHCEVRMTSCVPTLRREDGFELLSLNRRRLIVCRGANGALIDGVKYQKKKKKKKGGSTALPTHRLGGAKSGHGQSHCQTSRP
jgi:hypothetical protein